MLLDRGRVRRAGATLLKHGILCVFAALALFPLLLIVSTSLKSATDARTNPFGLFSSFRPENLLDAWTIGGFGDYFMMTVRITAPTVLGVLLVSVPAGYALARLRFPGRQLLYYGFILGLMVPLFAVMIPLFYQLLSMDLLGTEWAVILPAVAGVQGYGVPLGVFLMRSFFLDLPAELSEAARIDGASEFKVFFRIMLPLSWPGMAVLIVFVFFQTWNSFLLPLLYMPGSENRTLSTALYQFSTGRTTETSLLAAGGIIMIVPVLLVFLAFQRRVVGGLTAGALKG